MRDRTLRSSLELKTPFRAAVSLFNAHIVYIKVLIKGMIGVQRPAPIINGSYLAGNILLVVKGQIAALSLDGPYAGICPDTTMPGSCKGTGCQPLEYRS